MNHCVISLIYNEYIFIKHLLPYYYKKNTVTNNAFYNVTTIPSSSSAYKMTDKNSRTYTEFQLDRNDRGSVTINLKSSTAVTSSAIISLLDANVALPNSVEVSAVVNGQSKKLLAKSKMLNQTIRFPKTTSKDWKITFTYAQPLRINELKLVEEDPDKSNSQFVRFLAQPDKNYRLYFDSDRYVSVNLGESGNLYSNEDVLTLATIPSKANPFYTKADIDKDGIPDIFDNCVSIANKDQTDINNNNRGDACEDFDKDGITNDKDNCPNDPNRNQRDVDGDGIGEVCDTEESRITEKHKWIPWLGIIFALIVIIVLFVITAKSKESPESEEEQAHDEQIE